MKPERTERVCWACQHRGNRAGDCHIYCKKAFNPEANPLAEVFAILGGAGRTALPPATESCSFKPSITSWPGCGMWPANFDAAIVLDCAGYEATKQKTGGAILRGSD